ncbi:MAG: DUF6768 family protein [Phycisphaerae bacterium]|nr:DUF6768 family protein [Phycisphaerae bacterium]
MSQSNDTSDNEFDRKLKNALKSDPAEQPGVIEMAASTFRGRQRLGTIGAMLTGLGFMALMGWCAVLFFRTSEVREMILYATLFLAITGVVMMMKLWFFLLMIRYAIVRELKRVELQCSEIAGMSRANR